MKNTWERAQSVLIDGTGTFSKKPQCFVEGTYPTHCIGGSGSTIIGENGIRYVDWMCGLGANLYEVSNVFTLPHVSEVELAEIITTKFPCDKIKVLKSGSDACLAAIRYARAFTGKNVVYGNGYHGFGNVFISEETPGLGCVPEGYKKFGTFGLLLDALKKDCPDVGAVIVEPCINDLSVQGIVNSIRTICREKNILFIADEIVSGGRVIDYCFSTNWELDPDILCLGKGLANGFPIGIVGIRDRCLIDGCFISTTFSGETKTILESIKLLKWLDRTKLIDLWENGSHLVNTFNELAEKVGVEIFLKGYPTRATWEAETYIKAVFWERMLKLGNLCGAAWFISFSHTRRDVDKFLNDAEIVLNEIKSGSVKLQGQEPKPVFKRT